MGNDSKADVEWVGLPIDDPRNDTNAFTVERTAIQLFRAQAVLAEDYDGWWVEDETDENWRTLLVEAERDHYREVAEELLLRARLRSADILPEYKRGSHD